MKYAATFVEKTVKTIIIEAEDADEAQAIANECLDDVNESIDFEKNPNDYDVYCDEIKEMEE